MAIVEDKWGFVDDACNVYLKDGDSDMLIGSYPLGNQEEALAYYKRKYEEVRRRVDLIVARTLALYVKPKLLEEQICNLEKDIAAPKFLGDIQALEGKLQLARKNLYEARQKDQEHQKKLNEKSLELVLKMEALADGSGGHGAQKAKAAKEVMEKWRELERPKGASKLHRRMKIANEKLQKTLNEHFKDLRSRNNRVIQQKRGLIQKAREVKKTPDMYTRYRSILSQWKALPRLPKQQEEELWQSFQQATEGLVDAHKKSLEEVQLRQNAAYEEKLKLLEMGRDILKIEDWRRARREYLNLVENWERIGKTSKEKTRFLEDALLEISNAIKKKEHEEWEKTNPERNLRTTMLLGQLQKKLSDLQNRLKDEGDEKNAKKLEFEIEKTKSFIDVLK